MVDPFPVQWKKAKLRVDRNWWRLSLDVTHYDGSHYSVGGKKNLVALERGIYMTPVLFLAR